MASDCATETAWSRLSGDLRQFIRRRVGDDHLADDLLQETFLRIHRGIDRLRGADRLAAWVYRIARNVIHDHYRRNSPDQPLGDAEPADSDEANRSRRAIAGLWLHELIQELPEPYRDAVRWSELEGLAQQEIARRLGLSLSGAKSRVQRGRALLRDSLDRCCVFHFDRRGNLIDCDPKPDRTVCRQCDDLSMGPAPRS